MPVRQKVPGHRHDGPGLAAPRVPGQNEAAFDGDEFIELRTVRRRMALSDGKARVFGQRHHIRLRCLPQSLNVSGESPLGAHVHREKGCEVRTPEPTLRFREGDASVDQVRPSGFVVGRLREDSAQGRLSFRERLACHQINHFDDQEPEHGPQIRFFSLGPKDSRPLTLKVVHEASQRRDLGLSPSNGVELDPFWQGAQTGADPGQTSNRLAGTPITDDHQAIAFWVDCSLAVWGRNAIAILANNLPYRHPKIRRRTPAEGEPALRLEDKYATVVEETRYVVHGEGCLRPDRLDDAPPQGRWKRSA